MLKVKLKFNNDSFVAVPFEVYSYILYSPIATSKHYAEE